MADASKSIEERFRRLGTWEKDGVRAPHKPLLVLYALGRWYKAQDALIPFSAVRRDLNALLKRFGPPRRAHHPEYPFWWLKSDGVWRVESKGPMVPRKGHNDPKTSELLGKDAKGGFTPEVLEWIDRSPESVGQMVEELLQAHFPESLHDDILAAVGLPAPTTNNRRTRDARFRDAILCAYGWRCAISGLDLRVANETIGLDAAHIRWFQAGGPDIEQNGLALSVLHHKLFDRGAFTISPDLTVWVSDQVNGSDWIDEVLIQFHGRSIRSPLRPQHRPAREFLEWHRTEVFRGRPRP